MGFNLDMREEVGGRLSFRLEGLAEHIGEDLVAEMIALKMYEAAEKQGAFDFVRLL